LVCLKALEAGIEPGYATDLIEKGRLAAPPDAVASDLWPWPVKVTTLGAFRVVVRGTPVSFRGKAQRAPLNLLKALIAFGGHDVAESSLIDALWPDSDGVAGEQTLATTLFRLRKLVGADVVTRQGGRLGVAVAECWVDCRALERLLKSGVDDDSLVERVRRLYAGPFLQGEDDAPWALPLRERLHVALVKKLSMAAAAALGSGRIELAHGIYEAGIDIDDLVEAFYAGHIHCHITLGETSLAVTTYRRCQRVLQSRLGVAPSQATTRLYLSAIRGAGA
jgi:DNA-binding SARP family transcriptional activator